MRHFIYIGATVVLAVISAPADARTLSVCTDRASFLQSLSKKFGGEPKFRALTHNGHVIEVVVGVDRKWVIITTSPTGVTCGNARGGEWHPVADTKPKDPQS